MSLSNDQILDAIANKSVLEICDLITAMEDKFGVSAAAASVAVAAPAAAAAVEEKTEFDVKIKEVKDKMGVIKAIRPITGLGLKEAKDLVESAPCVVKEGISKADADAMKKALEEAGAVVEIV